MHKEYRIFVTIPLNSLMHSAFYWIFENVNCCSNPAAFFCCCCFDLFSFVVLFLCNELLLSLHLPNIITSRKTASKLTGTRKRNSRNYRRGSRGAERSIVVHNVSTSGSSLGMVLVLVFDAVAEYISKS